MPLNNITAGRILLPSHSIMDDCDCLPWSVQDPTAETINMNKMFYPKPWLEVIGFFDTLQVIQVRSRHIFRLIFVFVKLWTYFVFRLVASRALMSMILRYAHTFSHQSTMAVF